MKTSLQHCHLLEPDQCDSEPGPWALQCGGQWSLGDAHVLHGPHERPPSHLRWVSVGEVVSHPQVLLSHSLRGELWFLSQPQGQLCESGAGQRGGLRAPSSGLGAGPRARVVDG